MHFKIGRINYLRTNRIFKTFVAVAFWIEIRFLFLNKFLNILMATSFQYGLDKIADAFQKRANQLFKS